METVEKKVSRCKYCGMVFIKHQSLGAHTVSCKQNPSYQKNNKTRALVKAQNFSQKNPLITYTLVCATCGTTFNRSLREKYYITRKKHFCNRSCANKFSSNVNKDVRISKIIEYAAGIKVTKNCLVCNKEFLPSRKKQVYCSIQCSCSGKVEKAEKDVKMADPPFLGLILRGPYYHKRLGRRVVQLFEFGVRTPKLTMSYARYLMSVQEGRILSKNEEVDHKDGDRNNDNLTNLQVLTIKQHIEKTSSDKKCNKEFVKMECPTCGKNFVRSKSKSFISRLKTNYNVCSKKCLRVYKEKPNTRIIELFKESY